MIVNIQGTALEVLDDVEVGKVSHESFWVSCTVNGTSVDAQVDVFKGDGLEIRPSNPDVSIVRVSRKLLKVGYKGEW
jgi:hypothetical protein